MLATNDVFWLCGCLLIILIPVIWLARRRFGRPSATVVSNPARASRPWETSGALSGIMFIPGYFEVNP